MSRAADQLSRALEAFGLGQTAPAMPEPSADAELAALRQEVRGLLHDVVGSTTGARARAKVGEIVGRQGVLVVHLTAVELRTVKRRLEQERGKGS